MFSTLRNRFGIPGVISVIALVFAMFGGAYAASNSSGGGKATASAKAKKGPKGPKGATGPAGPAGPQGPVGANGKDGSNGANGSNGAAGGAGATGKSVETATLNPGQGGCVEGGASVQVAGEPATKKSVCNGEPGVPGNAGAPGAPGSPWTAGGTLPVGSTETGFWSFSGPKGEYEAGYGVISPLSFTVPLATPPVEGVYVPFNESNPHCPGSLENPKAASGYLCVYQGGNSGISEPLVIPQGVSGAGISFFGVEEAKTQPPFAYGSWAVTG